MGQLTVCGLLQLLQFFCPQLRVSLSHNSTAKKWEGLVQSPYTCNYRTHFRTRAARVQTGYTRTADQEVSVHTFTFTCTHHVRYVSSMCFSVL